MILGPEFFDRSTQRVARELLGKYLVRKIGKKTIALQIVETEAYHGFSDKASHARYGKTMRTWPMFEKAGTIYVYFTYGVHWMLNIVCGREKFPAAVLIRGVEGFNGPGKLTKFLKIDKSLNGKMLGKNHRLRRGPARGGGSGLWIEDRGVMVSPKDIGRTPRIGIAYAKEYVEKPWRFVYLRRQVLRKR